MFDGVCVMVVCDGGCVMVGVWCWVCDGVCVMVGM